MKNLMLFLSGLATGAVAGVMFAPKPGTETRRQFKGVADKTGLQVGQIVKDVKETALEAVDYGKGLADKVANRGKSIEKEAVVDINHVDDGVESLRTA